MFVRSIYSGVKQISNHVLVSNAEKVANFKRLRGGLVFIEQIPKTPTGKIMRRVLVERYKRQQSKL